MTRDDIRLLFEYDRWGNSRTLVAASKLTTEQFTRDLGGSLRSVRDAVVHILGGEWIWIQYWKLRPASDAAVGELLTQRDANFRQDRFDTVTTAQLKWEEIALERSAYLETLPEEALHETVQFRGARIKLSELMQHVVNHSTYHRGQVSLMMRQLGAEPIATDFHVFLVERRTAHDGH